MSVRAYITPYPVNCWQVNFPLRRGKTYNYTAKVPADVQFVRTLKVEM